MGDGQQPGFAITIPAPIDGNGFQAKIDGGKMGAARDAGLAQDRGGQQPAEPRRVLKDGKFVPGIKGDDRLKHCRQVVRLPQHAAPFVQPRVLVPIEIVDQRIFFRSTAAAGPCCVRDCGFRPGQHRIDRGIVDTREVLDLVGQFEMLSGKTKIIFSEMFR